MPRLSSYPDTKVDISGVEQAVFIHPVGADGLATTSPVIKSQIESLSGGGVVVFLKGTYTISDEIAINAHTRIVGDGDVKIGWGGAAGDNMFYNVAAPEDVIFEHIQFVADTNFFHIIVNGEFWQFIYCTTDNTSAKIFLDADYAYFDHCAIQYLLEVRDSVGSNIDNSLFAGYGYLKFGGYGVDTDDKMTVISNTKFISNVSRCVYFQAYDAATVIKNIKFHHCFFNPYHVPFVMFPCVELENNVNLTVEDLFLSDCTFKDGTAGISVPVNAILTSPRFKNGKYDNMTTKRTFTGTVTNPVFIMDGPL